MENKHRNYINILLCCGLLILQIDIVAGNADSGKILLGPSWSFWVQFYSPYWALLGLTGPYWALLGLTGPFWALLSLT